MDDTPLSEIVLELNIGLAGAFIVGHDRMTELFYQVSFAEDVLSKGPSVDFSVFFLAGLRFPSSALPKAGDG